MSDNLNKVVSDAEDNSKRLKGIKRAFDEIIDQKRKLLIVQQLEKERNKLVLEQLKKDVVVSAAREREIQEDVAEMTEEKLAQGSVGEDLQKLIKTHFGVGDAANNRLLAFFDCLMTNSRYDSSTFTYLKQFVTQCKEKLTQPQFLCVMLKMLNNVDATMDRKCEMREALLGADIHINSAQRFFQSVVNENEKMIAILASSYDDYIMYLATETKK